MAIASGLDRWGGMIRDGELTHWDNSTPQQAYY